MYPAPPVTSTARELASNGEIREAERAHLLGRVNVAAVEHDRCLHQRLHLTEVRLAKLIPLRDHRQSVGAGKRVVALLAQRDSTVEDAASHRRGRRIVRFDVCPSFEQAL